MTHQEQIQFTATLQLIVPQVAESICQEYGLENEEALKKLYNSQLYADLEREGTKLWHLSPLALAQLWHEGEVSGNIQYPEEA